MWDYNKDINLTLEDALISMESLRLMMGGKIKKAASQSKVVIHHTEEAVVAEENVAPKVFDHLTEQELTLPGDYRYINLTTGVRDRVISSETAAKVEGSPSACRVMVTSLRTFALLMMNWKASSLPVASERIKVSPTTL